MDSGFISNESRVVYETLNIIKRFTSDGILRSADSKAEAKEFKNGFPSSWFNEWEKAGFHLIDSWNKIIRLIFHTKDGVVVYGLFLGLLQWMTKKENVLITS
ncbi:hypothetical protein [Aneurinibacillus migulanus]|uniref:Uncharacterized protein n=2 Tax=Aneurinibacillus migulanus TaxID=47500 RepID=A0A1G8TT73_ANEMI|nr:hypothetical protein [Aneurinibacillus migulanus]MED0893584.1 hypothetical protein [Aneurinibacillus migulanus]MED1618948.1 hypothetical protein [Aneurinibacillus migulanus]SDJ44709.1 hypothetical protein SAMN04487909_1188 [Aneurinibacillus migulanus]